MLLATCYLLLTTYHWLLPTDCAKAGVDNVQRHTIEVGKDQWLKRRKRSFDRVLVDAPCSGVGAWRRNPDARWLRRTRPLDELLPVQAEVLRRAATLARPGGTLVYATCSLLPDENERQVRMRMQHVACACACST